MLPGCYAAIYGAKRRVVEGVATFWLRNPCKHLEILAIMNQPLLRKQQLLGRVWYSRSEGKIFVMVTKWQVSLVMPESFRFSDISNTVIGSTSIFNFQILKLLFIIKVYSNVNTLEIAIVILYCSIILKSA